MTTKKQKDLVLTIEWRVPVENVNTEEALDTLRETGSAQILDARIEDGR